MEKSINATVRDESRDRLLIVSMAGGEENDFGKLRLQLLCESRQLSTNTRNIDDENAAMTTEQVLDGRSDRGGV